MTLWQFSVPCASALCLVVAASGGTSPDLAPYDVVWTSPSADSSGSMPLGNGDIGVNAWCESNGDVLFYIGKTDAWSENGRLLKLGRVRLTADPPLYAPRDVFRQELDLATGTIRISTSNTAFPETMYFWGTWNNDNYGWDRTGKELGRADNSYIRWEWQGGIELTAMMLDYFDRTADTTFAANTLVPFADAITELYDQRYPRDPDGRIRFAPASALETYWEGTENPMPELAGLHHILERLLALPGDLTADDQTNRWARLLGELPDLPLRDVDGQTVLSPAETLGPKGNSENPELYAVFPYRRYGVGRSDLDLARRTYEVRTDRHDGGWGQDPIFAAMVGQTNDAAAQVVSRFGTKHSGSRFPAMWGPNYDWIPDQDHGGVAMIATQQMLMQTVGDRILLFPAWPRDWDVRFKLHAPGNTVLEGELKDGMLERFSIVPACRRKDVETFIGTLPGWYMTVQ